MSGKSAISRIPPDRWAADVLEHPTRGEPGRSVSFAAGVLDDAFQFDPSFFNISPRETAWMDPQQRLLLEMTQEALDDAGLADNRYRGGDCGVYIGISGMDYGQNALVDLSSMSAHTMTGNTLSIAANRISYVFDLRGPSLAIDTACSSSLAAVHEACQALRSGAISMALAGGINMLMHPYPFIGFSHASMLSASGQCRPFDAAGDGYVRGEGGAVLALKPLSAAIADGDRVHAVILGTGVNSDGAGKKGLTIPSAAAQTELMRSTLAKSGLSPDDLDYVEAHGTGTPVGDPAEAESIGQAYGKRRSRPLPISSAKANFGHLEPASGMAGLVKAVLALKHGRIPPMPFDYNPSPRIDFRNLNLYCAADGASLEAEGGRPLTVGVNSFGFGGLNAHILLRQSLPGENPPGRPANAARSACPPLVISAKTQKSLAELAGRYADLLDSLPAENFSDAAWNAARRRSLYEKRLALAGDQSSEWAKALRDFSQGQSSKLASSETALPKPGRIAFVYNGNGAQWLGMGRQLYQEAPAFARMLDRLDAEMMKVFGWSILDAIFNGSAESLQDTAVSQPILFAIQVGLTSLFAEMGVKPEAACGHSVGEIAAAWGAGALSLEEAIKIIHARSMAQGKTRGMGRMAVAGLGGKAAQEELERLGLSGKIEIAAANSPHNSTLSGDLDALEALGKVMGEKNIFFRMLDLDYAFHSRHMDGVKEFMESLLSGLAPSSEPQAIFFSTVKSRAMSPKELDSAYWQENMRRPVNFDASIKALAEQGINIFVEIGPHAILQRYIRENLPPDYHARVLPSMQQSGAGLDRVRATASAIYALAPETALKTLLPDSAAWISLPAYPWERQRHSYPVTVERVPLPSKTAPLLGWRLPGAHPAWEIILDPLKDTWLADHQVGGSVVFPAAAYVETALEAGAQWLGNGAVSLENFDILLPLIFENNRAQTLRCEINASDGSFIIQSRARMDDGAWLVHAKGRIISYKPGVSKLELDAVCGRAVSGAQLYEETKRLGLDYGPFFRRITSLSVKDGQIEAFLNEDAGSGYVLNPGALDACFHSLASIYADGAEAYLPVGFKDLKIFSSQPVKIIRGALLKFTKRTLHAQFELLDERGELVARVSDCRFRKLPAASKNPGVDSFGYRRLSRPLSGGMGFDSPRAIARGLMAEHKSNPSRKLWHKEILPRLEASVIAFIESNQNNLSAGLPPGLSAWMRDLILPYADREDPPDWKEIWREAHSLAPSFLAALLPPGRAMERLAEIMKGGSDVRELALLSETGHIAQENSALNPAFSGVDEILDNFLIRLLDSGGTINAAEAGAYARPLSAALAESVDDGRLIYTHIPPEGSPAFSSGEPKSLFAADPLKWFENEAQEYDAIILRQILHREADLKGALQTVLSALKPCGILLAAERFPDWSADLTCGIKETWWRKDREGKSVSSRMNPESWISLLESAGFEDCGFIAEPEAEGMSAGSYLLYARKRAGASAQTPPPAENWILLHDQEGEPLALKLAEKLLAYGHNAQTAPFSGRLDNNAEKTMVILGEAFEPEKAPKILARLNRRALQAAPESAVWIVTRGASPLAGEAASIGQAAVAGYARVLFSEKGGIKTYLRDLSPDLETAEAASALFAELFARAKEDEASLSREGRYVFSLSPEKPGLEKSSQRIKLDILQPGRLDNLAWLEKEETELGPDEAEARVMAAGLNFRDIMLAMGLLPEDALENGFAGPNLGLDFSGVVTAVGSNVKDFAPGDKVAGFAPASFASHARAPAASLSHIPQELDFTAAAAVPTIFITAWYALKHLAQLRKGEKLLIHGGAGGVGLAAIQIGKLLGAEIFATAGTEEKRDYLRLLGVDHILDSRSLAFADEILSLTGGRGVDVVLNSLAGEAMRRSVSILAPFGRFLELGKRDYVENTSIGLRPFKENISYFSIDVDQLLVSRPDLAGSVFEEAMAYLRDGRLIPPPLKVFESSQIEEAFRTMQQARHMGKVVVDMRELPPASNPANPPAPDYKGVWLISGGLSGFGLETARHLARNGAETLVLASRRGENIPEAEALKKEFSALGTKIFLKSCDLSIKEEVFGLIEWIKNNLPPLAGIVHAAAVFDDRRLEDLDEASFARSLGPKMLGAWHLHLATAALPLKYFIVFSSISAAIGNPGQGNYAAANAALEALTYLRVSQNLPASCLAWGPIGDAGYLTRNEAVKKNLSMQLGAPPLSSKQAMDAFDRFAGKNGTHILANVNWRRALEFSGRVPARLEKLFRQSPDDIESGLTTDLKDSLSEMSEEEALAKLEKIIAQEAAKVLGMDAAQTPCNRSLQALGMDSLMAMELALSLEQATGLRLPPMLLQDSPTISQLARRLWERLCKPANETVSDEAMLEELARRHSEELKPDEIQDLLKNIKNGNS